MNITPKWLKKIKETDKGSAIVSLIIGLPVILGIDGDTASDGTLLKNLMIILWFGLATVTFFSVKKASFITHD